MSLEEGLKLKEEGIARASMHKQDLIAYVRDLAAAVAESKGTVSVNDLPESLCIELGDAMGAVFKGGRFLPTGAITRAHRTESHARAVQVWKLR